VGLCMSQVGDGFLGGGSPSARGQGVYPVLAIQEGLYAGLADGPG